MDELVLDALWWALVFAVKAYWVCLCFYVPWQHFAAVEKRVRARRESVSR